MPHITSVGISATCDTCGRESPRLEYVLTEANRQQVRTPPEAYQQAELDLAAKGWSFQDGRISCPACTQKQAAD